MTKGNIVRLEGFLPERRPRARQPRPFGTIKRRGQIWYLKFPYLGTTVEVGTNLQATERNRQKLRGLLDRLGEAIREAQTVRLEEVFPNVSQDQKERWARLEGREYRKGPGEVTFGEYLDYWLKATLAREPSCNKQRDYRSSIESHLRPRFAPLTFTQITGPEVLRFVMDLVAKGLSKSRITNVQIPLRIIYREAVAEHGWLLPDPFLFVAQRLQSGRILRKRKVEPPNPFRFSEWRAVVGALDEWNRPIAEIMVMTGMSASELAGLRRRDVTATHLRVRNKISKGEESEELKTAYRARDLPLTAALRERIDVLRERVTGEYLVTRPDGTTFTARGFWTTWRNALRAACVPYRKPYTSRHTFAIWCLVIGVHPERVVALMGHDSRQMVYEVYGKYVDGLERDAGEIRDYVGEDFA